MPDLRRVAVLIDDDQFGKSFAREHERPAKSAGIQLTVHVVRRPEEVEGAFAAIAKERPGAVIVQPSLAVPASRASQIAQLALRHRLPVASQSREFADAGGLLSYGARFSDLHRRAAVYVDKILKGVKPAELPVEQATTFELAVNLMTARTLGVVVPPSLLMRADRVIE